MRNLSNQLPPMLVPTGDSPAAVTISATTAVALFEQLRMAAAGFDQLRDQVTDPESLAMIERRCVSLPAILEEFRDTLGRAGVRFTVPDVVATMIERHLQEQKAGDTRH